MIELRAQLQESRERIHLHAQAAYRLLPQYIEPVSVHIRRDWIERKAEAKEWEQVTMSLETFAQRNKFYAELLDEISLARQAMNQYDFLVARERLRRTTDEDKRIINECLRAIVHGPFIKDDGELRLITGFQRLELEMVAELWPDVENDPKGWTPEIDYSHFVALADSAAQGAMNNLLRYPHGHEKEWPSHFSFSYQQVERCDENWSDLRKQIVDL